MAFVACQQAAFILQPADSSLDLPATAIASQLATILPRRFPASFPMRSHKLGPAHFQCISQPVRISSFVIQQITDPLLCHPDVDQCFNRIDLSILRGSREAGNRNAFGLCQQHDLGAFSLLGLANLKTPFFAGEKVPSPIACDQCRSPRRSIFRIRRCQASTINPASVHSLCRRQHVEGEGYRSGRSSQRPPFLSIQKMPSRQARASIRGRPPLGEGSGFSNRSLIRFHCASEMKGFGAVLDPVVFGRRRFGHLDRVINMRASPFALIAQQLPCH